MPLTQDDIRRKIRAAFVARATLGHHAEVLVGLLTRAAGVVDDHGNIHSPVDGRFIEKAFDELDDLGAGEPDRKPVDSAGKAIFPAFDGSDSSAEVSRRAESEASRITGRDVAFDFGDIDPELAAELATGVLAGLEEFPAARLQAVRVGKLPTDGAPDEAFGETSHGPLGSVITFSRGALSDPAGFGQMLEEQRDSHHLAVGTPGGIALHEFGHVLHGLDERAVSEVLDFAQEFAHNDLGQLLSGAASRHISRYSYKNGREMIAEAVAQVVWGDRPSSLAQAIVGKVREVLAREA